MPTSVAIFDGAVDAMMLLDAAGVCTRANAAATQLFGCVRRGGSLVGKNFPELLRGVSSRAGEVFYVRVENVDVEATITRDAFESQHLVVLRKRRDPIENAAASALFEGAPCGMLVVSADLRVVSANRAMQRMGLFTGDPGTSLDTCNPSVALAVRDAIEECLITREPCNAEHIFEIAGKETWWLASSSPIFDASGALTHVVCSFFYVDFLKRTEEDLRQSEQSFHTIIDRIPDAVIVVARQGLVYANPAALKLFGVPSAAHISRSVMQYVHVADRARVRASIRSAPKLVEARLVRADGRHRAVELVAIRAVFEGRASVVAIVRDVTERNELHARLVQADRSIALGTLAGGVAHEINTPLSYVLTNVGFVLEQLEGQRGIDPELLAALRDAMSGTDRVASIVRELRALVRGDPRMIGPVDLRKTIDRVVQLGRAYVERHASLVVRQSDVGLVCGSDLLGQVFLNLLLNATHAIRPGNAAQNEVRLDVEPKDDTWVVVRVKDTGVGIEPQHIDRVFDPFFTTKTPGEGMGLGLPLALRVVEACGGRITVLSTPGHGATFEVCCRARPIELFFCRATA